MTRCLEFEKTDAECANAVVVDEERFKTDAEMVDKEISAENIDTLYADKLTKGILTTTDDPNMPAFTFRAIVLGTFFNVLLGLACSILSFRTNPINVPTFLATLLTYPMGIAMAKFLPRGFFNPGPFTIKEHVLAYIIASSTGTVPYGLDNVIVQKFIMGSQAVDFMSSLGWVLCSQLIGFGVAGIARRFLVRPKAMLWPGVLSQVALFQGFHPDPSREVEKSKFKISRYTFFWIVAGIMFCYEFLPSFILPSLTLIPVLCFLTSQKDMAFLGSASAPFGLGLGTFTLDWNYLYGTQMTSPLYATLNMVFGNVIWWYVLVPIFHYNQVFGHERELTYPGSPFPEVINSVALFNNSDFTPISPLAIMNAETYDLDVDAYLKVAPIRLTAAFSLMYGSFFMVLSATIVHVALWYHKTILKQLKDAFAQLKNQEEDTDNKLMSAYADIPEIVYAIYLVGMVFLSAIVCTYTPFGLPWYHILLAVSITLVFLLPIGVINATTGIQAGVNVIAEMAIGFLAPGKTIWVLTFKSLATNSMIQALNLVSDLKMGHYLHISPIAMVMAQLYGTILGSVVNTVAVFMMIEWVPMFKNLLESKDNPDWRYSLYVSFYSSGSIWGAIGPARFFGIGSVYSPLLSCFLIGAILPVIPYLANIFFPSQVWHLINIPIMSQMMPPQMTQNWMLSTVGVAVLSQYYALNYHPEWFNEYNYIMSNALDVGSNSVALVTAVFDAMEYKMPYTPDPETMCYPSA